MNLLLILGLIVFVCIVIWVYVLFIVNTTGLKQAKPAEIEHNSDNVLETCRQLYEQGLHSELQRYAQRELSKNYGDVELRKILAQSLMESGNEQLAVMHYEALLSISPYDTSVQELLAQYYLENGPKSRAIELYEQIMLYDNGNFKAVESLAKLYEETFNYPKAIVMIFS